jgi:hypothetical protein
VLDALCGEFERRSIVLNDHVVVAERLPFLELHREPLIGAAV